MYNTIIACDPGEEGAFAVFKKEDGAWFLDTVVRTTNWRELVALEPFPALGVTESNHGIQGQAAGNSYTQGYNAGMSMRTLEMLCEEVVKVIPQRWMPTFGVPKKNSFPGTPNQQGTAHKNWIREKAQKLTDTKLSLWASDAVAIGLSYIKEMKVNE